MSGFLIDKHEQNEIQTHGGMLVMNEIDFVLDDLDSNLSSNIDSDNSEDNSAHSNKEGPKDLSINIGENKS